MWLVLLNVPWPEKKSFIHPVVVFPLSLVVMLGELYHENAALGRTLHLFKGSFFFLRAIFEVKYQHFRSTV